MADQKKTIKGLKCCAEARCEICPYEELCFGEEIQTSSPMAKDAVQLLGEYHDFCRFVTKEMFDKWNECGECGNAEIYLRKLLKLGYVRLEDDVYSEVEDG